MRSGDECWKGRWLMGGCDGIERKYGLPSDWSENRSYLLYTQARIFEYSSDCLGPNFIKSGLRRGQGYGSCAILRVDHIL